MLLRQQRLVIVLDAIAGYTAEEVDSGDLSADSRLREDIGMDQAMFDNILITVAERCEEGVRDDISFELLTTVDDLVEQLNTPPPGQ